MPSKPKPLTSHEVARLLLAQPDIPLILGGNLKFFNDEPGVFAPVEFRVKDNIVCMDSAAIKKYTQEQLEQAFNLVKDKTNWKNPIKAKVPLDTDIELITEAVIHFTGGSPEIVQRKTHYQVSASGYYLCIGS